MSSVRSKEIKEPRYLKWAVKSMKCPFSSSSILLVVGEAQYLSSLCSAVMVLKVSGRDLVRAVHSWFIEAWSSISLHVSLVGSVLSVSEVVCIIGGSVCDSRLVGEFDPLV